MTTNTYRAIPVESLTPEWQREFWSRMCAQPDGCWRWLGSGTSDGYGQVWVREARSKLLAHRVAYTLIFGPVPDGLQLDHECGLRSCINPMHLVPVSPQVNTLRGDTAPARNAAKAVCPKCAGSYTTTDSGRRYCRPCALDRWKASSRRRRQGVDA